MERKLLPSHLESYFPKAVFHKPCHVEYQHSLEISEERINDKLNLPLFKKETHDMPSKSAKGTYIVFPKVIYPLILFIFIIYCSFIIFLFI